MRKQIRSIMCGCGNCAIRKSVTGTCPMWNSKEAIQLWHSDPEDRGSEQEEEESVIDEIIGIIEEVTREPQEIVL